MDKSSASTFFRLLCIQHKKTNLIFSSVCSSAHVFYIEKRSLYFLSVSKNVKKIILRSFLLAFEHDRVNDSSLLDEVLRFDYSFV